MESLSCPVCSLLVNGKRGLATHFRHQGKNPAHAAHLAAISAQEDTKWAAFVEGQDYVTCAVCDFKSETLARHLKTHGLRASEYREMYPGAKTLCDVLRHQRAASVAESHVKSPRIGHKKTIACKCCGVSIDVPATLALSVHDTRCDACKAQAEAFLRAEQEALWDSKTEGVDYVRCVLCGHRAENLTSHIRSAHPEFDGRYKSAFPGRPIVADSSAIRDKHYLRGRPLSEEVKAKMSANAGAWTRGLTKETDERIARAALAMKGRASWSKGLTKESSPILLSSSIKQSATRRGMPNVAARIDLSLSDFAPYLDETGAVDKMRMVESLKISDPTVRKYMRALGLTISNRAVAARAAAQVIRLESTTLKQFCLGNGKVLIAKAMAKLGHGFATVQRECRRHGLPTFTMRAQQTMCLEAIARLLGTDYVSEWRSPEFVNPLTGHCFRFDGFFPEADLLVEYHGFQHWTFPNHYCRDRAAYEALVERDRVKRGLVAAHAVYRYLEVRQDEPYAEPEYLRTRLRAAGVSLPSFRELLGAA